MSDIEKIKNMMSKVNISKVELANYLNVSRQMIYNYLSFNNFSELPLDKQISILNLFSINKIEEIDDIKVDAGYLETVKKKLVENKISAAQNTYDSLSGEDKLALEKVVINLHDPKYRTNFFTVYTLLEHAKTQKELDYLLGFLAKKFCITPLKPIDYNSEQVAFESLIYSAFNLFKEKKYSTDKVKHVYNQFVNEVQETINDEDALMSELTAIKETLGIKEVNDDNFDLVVQEVLKKYNNK